MGKERQRKLLGLSKNKVYYKPKGESEENQEIMKAIDKEHTSHPGKGVEQMTDALRLAQWKVNRKRVRRLMRLMGISAVLPKRTLSKLGKAKYVEPYLLKGLVIDHPNQVWSIDITYVPMAKGFMYLVGIIDVYSRAIMAWGLHNSLDAINSVEVLEEAVALHGAPEIINSDQGCQYTSEQWHECCKRLGITISMDGRGRCKDNIWIERFWRTIKMEHIYLAPADSVGELRAGISEYIAYYNNRRPHQGIERQIPMKLYSAKISIRA